MEAVVLAVFFKLYFWFSISHMGKKITQSRFRFPTFVADIRRKQELNFTFKIV
jgi:hypothetical protein